MYRFHHVFCFSLLVVFLSGCAASTPVKEAPLDQSKQEQLRAALTGTWKQTHRKESKDGRKQRLKVTIKKWTFNEDGTGTLIAGSENPVTGKVTNSNDFSWHLEGRNLALGDPGNKSVKFRVDDWTSDKMTWFDYPSSTYYIVEKVN
ncbi:MAG: lipocalin family protein [bacterium]